MNNPLTQYYIDLIARLKANVPSLHYIGADLGQMENYPSGGKPPLSFPAVLFDVDETLFEELSAGAQSAEGLLVIRICQPAYTGNADSIKPDEINIKALDYLETEQEVYLALQHFESGIFNKLTRQSTKTEKRNDEYRVRVIRFNLSYEDDSYANANTQQVATPDMQILSPYITKP